MRYNSPPCQRARRPPRPPVTGAGCSDFRRKLSEGNHVAHRSHATNAEFHAISARACGRSSGLGGSGPANHRRGQFARRHSGLSVRTFETSPRSVLEPSSRLVRFLELRNRPAPHQNTPTLPPWATRSAGTVCDVSSKPPISCNATSASARPASSILRARRGLKFAGRFTSSSTICASLPPAC